MKKPIQIEELQTLGPGERRDHIHDAGEPEVAVFWLIDGVLLYASTPIRLARQLNSRLIHRINHENEWRKYQSLGMFPGWPCDHHPLGRVEFDAERREFEILIDRCLAPDTPLFEEVRRMLHLPEATPVVIDELYWCYACRAKSRVQ
jgi:hypothetical protein